MLVHAVQDSFVYIERMKAYLPSVFKAKIDGFLDILHVDISVIATRELAVDVLEEDITYLVDLRRRESRVHFRRDQVGLDCSRTH